jgi:protochlorophyllide reductase
MGFLFYLLLAILLVTPGNAFSIHYGEQKSSIISMTGSVVGDGSRRREVLINSGIALSTMLTGFVPLPVHAEDEIGRKTIVITGANSGIGFEACKRLVNQGHYLVLACRTIEKARDAANRLEEYGESSNVFPAECDLASLKSIDAFVENLKSLLRNSKIDALCLNAGLSRNVDADDVARTTDGFELTVGTNHFGHFYLNHRLLPLVSTGGRIVVTASGVHDPNSPGGKQGFPAGLGDLEGLEKEGKSCEMIDGSPFNADKAYKDSKVSRVATHCCTMSCGSNSHIKGVVVSLARA